ncbi:hypothetical protein AVEN_229938-1 [Araneus ventricosus]|uniref:Uncharacterized protein n=1 Tax=Araneus ventricosus TaxID=182803 RepID=A0A4Y2BWD5_ARAVE|nr:hypothetical protein AVEN_229938-1 [Araneus ventricosus]
MICRALKSLKENEDRYYEISKHVMNKFLGHLSYLSYLSYRFLGDYVSQETKRKMVDALKTEENDEPLKRVRVDPNIVLKNDLHDFILTNTVRFLKS